MSNPCLKTTQKRRTRRKVEPDHSAETNGGEAGDGVRKILILMIAGGGGHLSVARALSSALDQLYGEEVAVSIVDVSKKLPFRPINQMDEIYRWLVTDGIWFWKMLWTTDNQVWIPTTLSRMLVPFFRQSIDRILRAESPDLVVSVHSFVNHIPLQVLRETSDEEIPFVTVVNDLVTAHPMWFCDEVDCCIVPTEDARQRALRYGMPADRVEVVGQPVRLEFASELGDKRDLREQLGLDLDRPCVLIVGGGDGVGPVYETACAIAEEVTNAQMVVVAGHNAALEEELRRTEWKIPTQIYGFVDNMPQLMGASDVLVTKAGPNTLAEAFIAGLPVIISSFIPGQEEGNIDYVTEQQAGAYASDPAEIARTVREWFRPDSDALEQVVANASALARPKATLDIARRLYELMEQSLKGREPEKASREAA